MHLGIFSVKVQFMWMSRRKRKSSTSSEKNVFNGIMEIYFNSNILYPNICIKMWIEVWHEWIYEEPTLCECSVSVRCSVGTWWYDRTLQRCARSCTTPQGTFVHTSLHSPRADAWSMHSAGLFCQATPPVIRTNSRTNHKRDGIAQFQHVQDAQGHTHILVLLEEN